MRVYHCRSKLWLSAGALLLGIVLLLSMTACGGDDPTLLPPAESGFLYTADFSFPSVSGHTVSSDGGLQVVVGSPFSVGIGPQAIVADASGRFMFVVNRTAGTISVLSRADSGSLAFITSVNAGLAPIALARVGNVLYAANQSSHDISAFLIDSAGSLTPLSGSPFTSLGFAPEDMAADPQGRFLFVLNGQSSTPGSSALTSFSVAANGTLTPIVGAPMFVPTGTKYLAVDRTGNYLFRVTSTTLGGPAADAIVAMRIDSGGGLTETQTLTLPSMPGRVVVNGQRDAVYVPYQLTGSIGIISIGSSGTLALGQTVPVAPNPTAVEISASGDLLFVGHAGSNNISVLEVDSSGLSAGTVSGSPFSSGGSPATVLRFVR